MRVISSASSSSSVSVPLSSVESCRITSYNVCYTKLLRNVNNVRKSSEQVIAQSNRADEMLAQLASLADEQQRLVEQFKV